MSSHMKGQSGDTTGVPLANNNVLFIVSLAYGVGVLATTTCVGFFSRWCTVAAKAADKSAPKRGRGTPSSNKINKCERGK